jgi:hypothetical protein
LFINARYPHENEKQAVAALLYEAFRCARLVAALRCPEGGYKKIWPKNFGVARLHVRRSA